VRFDEGPDVVKLSDTQHQAALTAGHFTNGVDFPREEWTYTPDSDGVYWLCYEDSAGVYDWDYKDVMTRITPNPDGSTTLLITSGIIGYQDSLVDLIDGSEVAPIPSNTLGAEVSLPAPNLLDHESATSHDIIVEVSDGEHVYTEAFQISVRNVVDIDELNTFIGTFRQEGDGLPGDLNGDGRVNLWDFAIMRANFGKELPAPAPATAPEAPAVAPVAAGQSLVEPIAETATPGVSIVTQPLDWLAPRNLIQVL
jgi:hypothetical protein